MGELYACPFCRSEVLTCLKAVNGGCYVGCVHCGARTKIFGAIEDAKAAWNRCGSHINRIACSVGHMEERDSLSRAEYNLLHAAVCARDFLHAIIHRSEQVAESADEVYERLRKAIEAVAPNESLDKESRP
ncbi:MAG: hypothetical protein AMXMBFR84_37640 [Candidatus Hydrogenedentota bacterium]